VRLDLSRVLSVPIVAKLVEVLAVLDRLFALHIALLLKRVEFVLAVGVVLIDEVSVTLRVRLILALFQDKFCAFLHRDLKSVFASTPHFLDAVLLALQHLLRLYDFATLISQQKVLDCIITIYGVIALQEVALVAGSLVSGDTFWRALLQGGVRCEATTIARRRVVRIHALCIPLPSLWLLILEDEARQVCVRLCQIERLWLRRVVAAAALSLQQVLIRLVEVVWVG